MSAARELFQRQELFLFVNLRNVQGHGGCTVVLRLSICAYRIHGLAVLKVLIWHLRAHLHGRVLMVVLP